MFPDAHYLKPVAPSSCEDESLSRQEEAQIEWMDVSLLANSYKMPACDARFLATSRLKSMIFPLPSIVAYYADAYFNNC
jgi:hypothetical protein